MIGYKIAVAVNKIYEPFLALVTLETFNESTIISPQDCIGVNFEICTTAFARDIADKLLDPKMYIKKLENIEQMVLLLSRLFHLIHHIIREIGMELLILCMNYHLQTSKYMN